MLFRSTVEGKQVEVLRISKDGITANPDIPVDEAAQAVIRALNSHIERMIERASKREWVGLTDEEVVALKMGGRDLEFVSMTALRRFACDIEAKLKEKNA